MPRKKTQQQPPPPPPPVTEDYLDPDEGSLIPDLDDEPEPQIPTRKKNRNAHTSAARPESSSPESSLREAIAPSESSPSPPYKHSILDHEAFATYGKTRPVNIREDVRASEKVSDQYTPPSDGGLHDELYGRSPQSLAVSSNANTPPVEPGFSSRQQFKPRSPPVSPPQRTVRPLSIGGSIPPSSVYARRPYSNYGSPPTAPPLPHMAQPHFYNAQDIDIGVPIPAQTLGAEEAVFTKLVRLSTLSGEVQHAIVTGYEDRLSVTSFDGDSAVLIGALTGLSGTVVDAELLHWTSGPDTFADLRPLVAVASVTTCAAGPSYCHTFTVSVHSLSHQRLVQELFRTTVEQSQQMLLVPQAMGPAFVYDLRLSVAGNYLSVSSGKSGEVFVFCPAKGEFGSTFECLGKFWTTIQPKERRRDSSHHRVATPDMITARPARITRSEDVPMLSISGRWLAVCPPVSGTRHSIRAVLAEGVLVRNQAGLEATSPSSRPAVNCGIDSPDADTLFGKVARGAAQQVMKAGRWIGDQGMQAIKSYWNREDQARTNLPQAAYTSATHQNALQYGQFPPTHADITPAAKDPEIVSIYDLKSMSEPANKRAGIMSPIATFQPPHGCSFLSFAPHGLMLLTASRKGDQQYVWDLLEMKHTRALAEESGADGIRAMPRVRQLARFDRLSGSTIVDVVWEKPTLSRLAILTKNKTVHLFDLPASAMRWPPPRKAKKARPISAPPSGTLDVSPDAAPAGGFLASAMNFAGRTQPMIATFRGRTPSTGGGFSGIGQAGFGIATATGARGSKAVAAGLSKSLGAATETVSRLQHAGDNKLHLKTERDILPGRLFWLRRGTKSGICVLSEDSLKYYQVRRRKARDPPPRDVTVFEARRAVTIKLPGSTSETSAGHDARSCPGFWSLKTNPSSNAGNIHPLSFAEIDTNAPFQPFHSDQRVTLSMIEPARPSKQAQWVFGDDIPTVRLNTRAAQSPYDDDTGSVIYRETSIKNNDLGGGEQIVSTTRKRKVKRSAEVDGDDAGVGRGAEHAQEGFFEDDCQFLDFASDRV